MISQLFSITTNVEPLSYIVPDDTLGEYVRYVCMYVCTACMYVCMYVCTYVCTLCVYVCMYINIIYKIHDICRG